MYPVTSCAALRSWIAARTSCVVAEAGRSTRIDVMPTSAQSRCLPATYDRDAGSSPTRSVPSPGTTPCAFRSWMRVASSDLTADAVATPSRVIAVMSPALLLEARVQRERGGERLDARTERRDIRFALQCERDEVGHLGELGVAEPTRGEGGGADAQARGDHRRAGI